MDVENTQGGDVNVDEIMEGIEKPAADREMTSGDAAPAPQAAATPEPPAWNGDEWAFEWNGKRVVPDSRDKLKTWMSQGYNYSQRMGEFNKQRGEWERKVKDAETLRQQYERYREVDEYAKKNPDWWKHVETGYQSRSQPQIAPELQPILQPILKDLEETKGVLQAWQQERQTAEEAKANEALDSEIQSIRKSYPNIDLTAVDETGETLELRVLKHAQQIGTGSFRAAFRDYLHDKLVDLAKADGREALAKDKQTQAKKGVLGTTQAPLKGLQSAQNHRGKSYDNLAREALAELGIA